MRLGAVKLIFREIDGIMTSRGPKGRARERKFMEERIQKIIAAAGVASRRAAEQLIAEGRVRVNGQVVTEPGTKADSSRDHIKVDGKLINPKQPPTYIMLNKPAGFVTTMSDPEGRPTVQDLVSGVKTRVYPVGRLDYNTEGLLLLTNDGDFAHLITHPKHEFPKTYLAKVKGVLSDAQIETLEKGMFLQDGRTAPAKVKKVRKEEANSWIEITIHEGRKRQVRRMFDHVGSSVIKLKRTRTGSLLLGDLPEGRFRHLASDEIRALRDTALKTDESGRQVKVYKPAAPARRVDVRTGNEGGGPREKERRVPTRRPGIPDTRSGLRKSQGMTAMSSPRRSDIISRRDERGQGPGPRRTPGRAPVSGSGGRRTAFSRTGSGRMVTSDTRSGLRKSQEVKDKNTVRKSEGFPRREERNIGPESRRTPGRSPLSGSGGRRTAFSSTGSGRMVMHDTRSGLRKNQGVKDNNIVRKSEGSSRREERNIGPEPRRTPASTASGWGGHRPPFGAARPSPGAGSERRRTSPGPRPDKSTYGGGRGATRRTSSGPRRRTKGPGRPGTRR